MPAGHRERAAGHEPYAGRTLLSEQQSSIEPPVDQAGATPLAEQGTPILGDRVYLGLRFNSELAIESADLPKTVHELKGTKDSNRGCEFTLGAV